ncbi:MULTISPECIES: heat-inducible transcriptional repressor HrcA [unclassified Azospirillum]|uniref:heat-inducible transcriptional repressor HrcA n=1 Tax=unclassified Azospirillum TaxID=2630922 RepID=UPI000B6DE698|nr:MULTISPECIES: heat-inducible transcriptional repressor HrcA [unclassified Azospirillum]SNS55227.1 heat-inducible transcription repressor HrcA [Azospirillum sp. RU38E]SNS74814.1 heat-inducible transcription repressor HrcA [Azospirillum sp. RU37A]
MISELNQRSREVFREIVEAYVQTGEPVGSRTLSRRLTTSLSPATIRNVMADLEDLGLLMAPHTSAGRVPTDAGLRLFVNGILEIGALSEKERTDIEARCVAGGRSMPEMLEEATNLLSGLSSCAGLVLAPKTDRPLKHIEFINLSPGRALVVLVTEDGLVENRVVEVAVGLPPSALQMASNYLNARVVGRTLAEARTFIQKEMEDQKSQLDALTAKVVETGLATWAGTRDSQGYLIVRGQARLLEDVTALSDLERIRNLFEALETREQMMRMLDATGKAEGVQIFIGAESELFSHAGCSMIVSPYMNTKEQIVGAIGVIGPARINYARIIPMVDYTAKVIGRLMG